MTRQPLQPAAIVLAGLLIGGTACSGPPEPTNQPPPSGASSVATPSSHASGPSASGGNSLEDLVWYEVDRVGDTQGDLSRSLLFGSLAGEFRGRVALAQASSDSPESEPFAWTDPQVGGIFNRHAVVWGRGGDWRLIEAFDLVTGRFEPLVSTEDIVHVATADATLERLFLITVDPDSRLPTGLWRVTIGEPDLTRLDYRFSEQPVSRVFTYRIVASEDGSMVAVQATEEAVAIIDVQADQALDVQPGGPVIGFAADSLVTYGAPSATGSRPLIAYDLGTLDGRTITEDVFSAQIVPGTDGDIVVGMHMSEADPTAYQIEAIEVASGESSVAYVHESAEIGPLLARLDRAFLGYELPPDWVLLVDSFLPFVEDPSLAPKSPSESTYPLALNLRTGETTRLGPFTQERDG